MAGILKLKHIYPNELPDQKFYFYEGEVDVHFGVIELPRDPAFTHWAMRAWMKGFRLDPETDEPVSRDELLQLLEGQAPAKPESTKSAGETNEGSDVGGQPVGEDGVRESEQSSRKGIFERLLGGSLGSGSVNDGDAGPDAG